MNTERNNLITLRNMISEDADLSGICNSFKQLEWYIYHDELDSALLQLAEIADEVQEKSQIVPSAFWPLAAELAEKLGIESEIMIFIEDHLDA